MLHNLVQKKFGNEWVIKKYVLAFTWSGIYNGILVLSINASRVLR